MKTFTTLTAVAALVVGMSVASAQNKAGPAPADTSPSNLNAGTTTPGTPQSGAQSKAAVKSGAMKKAGTKNTVTGKAKFCISGKASANTWNCSYATLAACETAAKPVNETCQPKANLASAAGKKSGVKTTAKTTVKPGAKPAETNATKAGAN